eukprot:194470-Amphidinium_carterae.1
MSIPNTHAMLTQVHNIDAVQTSLEGARPWGTLTRPNEAMSSVAQTWFGSLASSQDGPHGHNPVCVQTLAFVKLMDDLRSSIWANGNWINFVFEGSTAIKFPH